jgi:nucleoside-diphosphate-sugar epimerase
MVDAFFSVHPVDIVLHTAVKAGPTLNDFKANIDMFQNLKKHSEKYKFMFSFGSGAAFNQYSDVELVKEEDIPNITPSDYYGLAKNIIAREIITHDDNIINLRLFGCFGTMERNTRFIQNSLNRINKGLPIYIFQDREIDFFYVGDLIKVIEHLMEQDQTEFRDYNMCYADKATLADIAHQINLLTNNDSGAIIEKTGTACVYTGSSKRLSTLNLNLSGLTAGIQEVVQSKEDV